MAELLIWWVMVEVIGLAALPIMMVLARALPGRGYGLSKVLGIVLVSYGSWLLANLHLAAFGQGLLLFMLAALTGVSAWLLLRRGGLLLGELRAFVRDRRSVVITSEVVFAAFFFLWAFFRALDPDMNGQEKWMDFGFINSVLNSGSMPPNDMWLSGHHTNYYYFGYVMAASMIALSGVDPNIGYNLANILTFALGGLGCYTLAYEMVSLRLHRNDEPEPSPLAGEGRVGGIDANTVVVSRRGVVEEVVVDDVPEPSPARGEGRVRVTTRQPIIPHLIGIFAALTIMLGGSLAQVQPWFKPAYIVDAQKIGAWAEPPEPVIDLAGPLATPARSILNPVVWDAGWYGIPWNATRLIHDWQNANFQPTDYGNITETPGFSAVLNDFHPHYAAFPVTMLALLVGLALLAGGFGRRWLLAADFDARLTLIVAAIVIGSLYFANTWDYPTYLLIAVLVLLANRLRMPNLRRDDDELPPGKSAAALGFAALPRTGSVEVDDETGERSTALDRLGAWLEGRRWLGWLAQAGALVVLSLLAVSPYLLTYKAPFGQANIPVEVANDPLIYNIVNAPIVGSIIQRLFNIVTPNFYDKSFEGFLILFGVFLYAILTYLLVQVVRAWRRHGLTPGLIVAGVAVVLSLALAFAFRFPLLPLDTLLIAASLYVLIREPQLPTADRFVLLLVGVAGFLALGCEMFFLNDVFNRRMNTLFKFYYQLWLIFGLLAAYSAWWVGGKVFGYLRDREQPANSRPNPALAAATAVWAVGFSFLVLLMAIYPILNIRARLLDNGAISRDGSAVSRPLSLDSWARLAENAGLGGDKLAMDWMRANIPGDAVIIEANPDQEYQVANGGRVSSYTGRPAVLAWAGHQYQWHKGDGALLQNVEQRKRDIQQFFTLTDLAQLQAIVDKYRIQYIFFGSSERGIDSNGAVQAVLRNLYPTAYDANNVTIFSTPYSEPAGPTIRREPLGSGVRR